MFLIDSASKLKPMFVTDNFSGSTLKANVRFFNVSPNSATVTVGLLQGTTFTPLFSNRGFETQTSGTANEKFIEVTPGVYSVQVRRASDGFVLLTANDVTLQNGRYYTQVLRGFNSVEAPLILQTLMNH